jgi:hypothetical protein
MLFKVENHDLDIDVKVENTEACPHYAGVTIKGRYSKGKSAVVKRPLGSIGCVLSITWSILPIILFLPMVSLCTASMPIRLRDAR